MKLLMPVKRVVSHDVNFRVSLEGSGVKLAGGKMSMNSFGEDGNATEIVVVSIGPLQAADHLSGAGEGRGPRRPHQGRVCHQIYQEIRA